MPTIPATAALSFTPRCVWLTGLSGAGKSTLAELLVHGLRAQDVTTLLLDGDQLRRGLCSDLGFSEADRIENIRRTAEVARLAVDAGSMAVVSLISPFQRERQLARARFDAGRFIEVFVDTPLAVCEERDVKGLYAKARRGELKLFTGIDSPYEPPQSPELRIPGWARSPQEGLDSLLGALLTPMDAPRA